MESTSIFPRDITPSLLKWIDRREAYAIKGPRQGGKTTLMRILEDALMKRGTNATFLNFEDPDVLEAFEANPKEYIKSFITKKGKYCFLMDEYHYVGDSGKKLKLLYDAFDDVKFIVTGSSSLEIGGAMARYLVGRVFTFELFQFSFHEFLLAKNQRLALIYEKRNGQMREFLRNGRIKIGRDIFLREFRQLFGQYVTFGGYPAVLKADDPETKRMILKGIYDTYVSKDVVEFLKFTDALKYRLVVRTLSALMGNLINYNEICSSCQTYFKELKRIISMLSETYIISLVQPFHRNPVTELKKTPKIYFGDTGLRNQIMNNFDSLEDRVDRGALVENFVFLSLRNDFHEAVINYWRTIAKAEVDFVLRMGDDLIPIEVKYQDFKEPKVSRGLRSFIETYKARKGLTITKDFWGIKKIDGASILFIPAYYL